MCEELVDDQSTKFKLQKELCDLRIELDTKCQLLYSCQCELKSSQAMIEEYQQEVELLQNTDTVKFKELKIKIHQLEDEKSAVLSSFTEQVQSLEISLSLQQQENEQLKNNLKELSHSLPLVALEDYDKVVAENLQLKKDLEVVSDNLTELRSQFDTCQNENVAHEERIKDVTNQLENIKEIAQCRYEELQEEKHLIQTLQDEIACLKMELDTVHNKPLAEESKGNSLFAEVNDKRLQMLQTMQSMKAKYTKMKSEKNSYLKKISELQSENLNLLKQWKEDLNKIERDEETIINNLKARNRTLELLHERYKNEQSDKGNTKTFGDEYKMFDNMLNLKKEEINKLEEELDKLSLYNTVMSRKLCEANREMRSWRCQVTEQENEIDKLKIQLKELTEKTIEKNVQHVGIQHDTEIQKKGILKLSNTDHCKTDDIKIKEECKSIEELKENIPESEDPNEIRKVCFSKDTVDNVTNRHKHQRRAGKIFIAQPVVIHKTDTSKSD